MKKLFLFALSAMMICSCSESGTEDNPNPNPIVTLTDIELSPNILEFDITGGEKSIYIYLKYDGHSAKEPNDQWKLTGGDSWCTPSVTIGNNGDEITFSVGDYSENRTTVFTIACGNVNAELTIVQKGYTSVNVEQVGTLNSVLSEFDATSIKMLRITGNLNDEDFFAIRNLSNLEYLDISELPLTTLPAKAFNSLKLKSVALPKLLTVIPESLFEDCSLKDIEIPSNVETIEKSAFYGCSKMTSIVFNSKLKTIKGTQSSSPREGAFCQCTSLASITIPSSVEIIEAAAFYGCKVLTTVTFEKPSSLKIIGGDYVGRGMSIDGGPYEYESYGCGAFNRCAITSVEIPASVEEIQMAAFNECNSLTTVTFEENSQLKKIGGINGRIIGPFANAGAFSYCRNLKTIDASNCKSVTYVDAYAFCNCPITFFKIGTINPPINLGTIGDNGQKLPVFSSLASYSILKVPAGSVGSYKATRDWNSFSSITELDN